MPDETSARQKVDEFIVNEIESVPHLEALLLVWNQRPRVWTAEDMARSLYVKPDIADRVLQDLAQRNLLQSEGNPTVYSYAAASPEHDVLLRNLDRIYRAELVRVSTLIHSKASSAVREFARAFRFTKDKK